MKKKRLILCAMVFGMSSGMAWAVDLLDCYRAAKSFDATYAAAYASYQAGVEKAPQGLAPLLPQISATGTEQQNQFTNLPTYTQRTGQITLTQTLFDWGKFAQYSIGQQQALIALDQFHYAEQDLILRVAQAYFDVLLAQDTLALTQLAKQAFAQQLVQAKKSFELGSSTIVDTYDAQANDDNAAAQEIQAHDDLVIKRNALSLLANVNPEALAPLGRDLPLIPPQPANVDVWLQQADQHNFTVLAQQKQWVVAQKQIAVSRSGHLPQLSLTGGYQDSSVSSAQADVLSPPTRGSSIGLQLTIPLFSGGGVQSQVRENAALAEKAQQNWQAVRRKVAQDTRTAFVGVRVGWLK